MNTCGGITVGFVKSSKIGKALNSVSKSTVISKPIKASVDELILDWKQKFVQEGSSSTMDAKKKSATNGEKRKQRPDGDIADTYSEASNSESPPIESVVPYKKKGKYFGFHI